MSEQVEKNVNAIFEVKTFTDKRGFEVRELSPSLIENNLEQWSSDGTALIKKIYFGMAHVMLPTGNPEQPAVPHPVQVNFPPTITSIEQAFNTMESEIDKELQRQIAEAKAKEEQRKKNKSKELILPGQANEPMTIPFQMPSKK